MNSRSRATAAVPLAGVPLAAEWDAGRWRSRAACRGEDSDLFFPIAPGGPGAVQITEAKQVCARCPVQQACLDFAFSIGQDYGIWGGYTEEERRSLRRRRLTGTALPDTAEPSGRPLPRRSRRIHALPADGSGAACPSFPT